MRKFEASGELDLDLLMRSAGKSHATGLLFEILGWGNQKDIANANLSSSLTGVF